MSTLNGRAILDARFCDGWTGDFYDSRWIQCPYLRVEYKDNIAYCGVTGCPECDEPECTEVPHEDGYRYLRCPECPWSSKALDVTPMEVAG